MVAKTLISFIDEHSASRELLRKSEELKDLIRHRLSRLGLKQTAAGLRPDLWELKLRGTDLVTTSSGLSEVPDLLLEARSDLSLHNDEYTRHSLHAFEVYSKTVTGVMQRMSGEKDITNVHIPPDLDMPYHTVLELLELPHWTFRYLANWLNSSLDLDIGFLILSIHREEPIIPDQAEFIDFIRSAGERFGAYAEVLDFWWIPDEDESQPIRNTKILAAALRSQTDLPRIAYSAQELKAMLAGNEV